MKPPFFIAALLPAVPREPREWRRIWHAAVHRGTREAMPGIRHCRPYRAAKTCNSTLISAWAQVFRRGVAPLRPANDLGSSSTIRLCERFAASCAPTCMWRMLAMPHRACLPAGRRSGATPLQNHFYAMVFFVGHGVVRDNQTVSRRGCSCPNVKHIAGTLRNLLWVVGFN